MFSEFCQQLQKQILTASTPQNAVWSKVLMSTYTKSLEEPNIKFANLVYIWQSFEILKLYAFFFGTCALFSD